MHPESVRIERRGGAQDEMEGEIGEEISLTMAGDWMRGEAGETGME